MQAFAVLGVGFLAVWLVAEALRRRLLVHASLLFVALGVLAGPSGLAVVDVSSARPAVGLVLGWAGLMVGLSVRARPGGHFAHGVVRAGFLYGFVLLGLLGAAAWSLLGAFLPSDVPPPVRPMAAAVIAAAALAASPDGVATVASRFGARGPVRDAGEALARTARGIAVLAYAIALAFHDRPTLPGVRALAPTEWLLAELLLGVALGLLADGFLADEEDPRRATLTLAVGSAFATGVAWHLGLSTLLVNLVIGAVLANVGRHGGADEAPVRALEQPVVAGLLLLAGATWVPPADWRVWAVVAALVALRIVVAGFAGATAGRALDPTNPGLRRIGFTLVGQGTVAVGIALAWTLVAAPGVGQLVLTIVGASAVLNDLWAVPAARLVLDEAGEIPTLGPEP